jgi:hypothetical protein
MRAHSDELAMNLLSAGPAPKLYFHRGFIGTCQGGSVPTSERRNTVAERDISSGAWTAQQSNNHGVRFNLDQTQDGRLSGTADAFPLGGGNSFSGTLDEAGSLVRGNMVQIVVDWSQGSRGKYVGSFDLSGRLFGNTFDLANPQSQATWFSDKIFR